ncbi:MAG TPA: Uma2 family endonuclease, partial [Acidimicrobiales bacterium]
WIASDHGLDFRAARYDLPPALVVEVRSPGTWRYDVGRKKAVYEAVGVRELWLVDTPVSTVLVFRRASPESVGFDEDGEVGPGDTLASPLLPGFALTADELFA